MNRFGQIAFFGALSKMNLAPVKSMKVTFDPFHPRAQSAREFAFHVNSKRRLKTNPRLIYKTALTNDRSPPVVDVVFNDGQQLLLKTEYLTPAECIESLNSICQQKIELEQQSKK